MGFPDQQKSWPVPLSVQIVCLQDTALSGFNGKIYD